MKVVILAGGLGTRLAEETEVRPKPMVEIGSQPILWHIMKHYAVYGHTEFYIALGYKSEYIKRYFLDTYRLRGNLSIDFSIGRVDSVPQEVDAWMVHLIETGLTTNTGGRVRRLRPYLEDAPFLLTYGDGVSNVDLDALVAYHREQGCLATITAVRPPARFGGLLFDGDRVAAFTEKPQAGEGWINGGFMVLEPAIFDCLHSDDDSLESDLLERLAEAGQLAAYRHADFWQCMDTLRDKRQLEALWNSGEAPWKLW